MADSIYTLDPDAANNTALDGIAYDNNQLTHGNIDNLFRATHAKIAQFRDDLGGVATTAGTANAQTVTLASGFTAYAAGQIFRVKIGSGLTNTSSTVTMAVNSISGAKTVKVNYGGVLADPLPGDLQAGAYADFLYDGTYLVLMNAQQRAPYPSGHLYGLTLSNNSGTPSKLLDIAAGTARSSDDSANIDLLAAITAKDIETAWAVGSTAGMLATGVAVTNTTYHIFLIKRPDTGVVDIAADTSVTGANIAANTNAAYTLIRRIGSILRVGGSIVAFSQNGDEFLRSASILDVSANAPGTSAVTRTLSVPTGAKVYAIFNSVLQNVETVTGANVYFSALDQSDEASSYTSSPLNSNGNSGQQAGANNNAAGRHTIRTNTSGQIRSRVGNNGGANVTLYIATLGWIDTRGRV